MRFLPPLFLFICAHSLTGYSCLEKSKKQVEPYTKQLEPNIKQIPTLSSYPLSSANLIFESDLLTRSFMN